MIKIFLDTPTLGLPFSRHPEKYTLHKILTYLLGRHVFMDGLIYLLVILGTNMFNMQIRCTLPKLSQLLSRSNKEFEANLNGSSPHAIICASLAHLHHTED